MLGKLINTLESLSLRSKDAKAIGSTGESDCNILWCSTTKLNTISADVCTALNNFS